MAKFLLVTESRVPVVTGGADARPRIRTARTGVVVGEIRREARPTTGELLHVASGCYRVTELASALAHQVWVTRVSRAPDALSNLRGSRGAD